MSSVSYTKEQVSLPPCAGLPRSSSRPAPWGRLLFRPSWALLHLRGPGVVIQRRIRDALINQPHLSGSSSSSETVGEHSPAVAHCFSPPLLMICRREGRFPGWAYV